MKRLVLHIGMEKTGTSTIQNALGDHSQELSEHGIVIPDWRPFNHSYDFTTLFMEDPKRSLLYKKSSPISDNDWSELLEAHKNQWENLFASFDSGTCIVSAENLCQRSRPEIERILNFAKPHFNQLMAIAYVRNPMDSIKSRWEQKVKAMREPLSGEQLLASVKDTVSFRFIDRWSDALGSDKVHVRNFNHAIKARSSLLHDFFHTLGLPESLAEPMEDQSSNTSLGREGAAFLLAFNAKYPVYVGDEYNPDRGLARHLPTMYRAMRSVKSEKLQLELHFSEPEARKINREIRTLNQHLPENQRIDELVPSGQKTELPTPDAIGTEYYVDLINQLALTLDRQLAKKAQPAESQEADSQEDQGQDTNP